MRIRNFAAVVAAGLTCASCVNFTGDKLDKSPNSPLTATIDNSFVSVQGIMFSLLTSDLAMFQNVVMQQLSGNGRQWISYDQYEQPEDFQTVQPFYTTGGLIDIRKAQAVARAGGYKSYLGILQVWEALVMGVAADTYGDIGYSTALNPDKPATLDPQQQVYASLQGLLDSAITNLAGGGIVTAGSKDLALPAHGREDSRCVCSCAGSGKTGNLVLCRRLPVVSEQHRR
jgi:starch-binding outer membrane protein, SusD/RagB family